MLYPEYTNQFKKDYKKCKKRGLPLEEIQHVMSLLIDEQELPPKSKDHVLKGSYKGYGECHIRHDWLLIYLVKEKEGTIIFTRTGTHTDLFD
jgi:mRNA interferase YafQ